MVLPRVGVGGLLHGAYNYTGCYPRQVVFRRRSIRGNGQLAHCVSRPSPTRSASEYHSPAVPYHTPTRGSLSTPYRFPFTGTTDIIPNQSGFAGGWECAWRFASQLEATNSPLSIGPDTVRQWRWERPSHSLAFRRFCDLRGFASLVFHCRRLDFKFAAKRCKSQKVGHFTVPASRGRAPAATCDNQPDASVSSDYRHDQQR